MKCPKCSYVSHDYLNACRKCRVDLLGFKAQMQLHVVQAGSIDLRSVLSGVQANPLDSGEYPSPDGELFRFDAILGESQAEDRFDINLDDDFSFTPSGMSVESLDGFEVSHTEALELGRQRPAATDSSETEAPETGYATVMMDISGMSDAGPPPESDDHKLDAPTGADTHILNLTIESSEAIDERHAWPESDAPVDNTAELWSPPTERDSTEAFSDEVGELTLPSLDTHFATTESTSPAGGVSDAHEDPFTMPELPNLDTEEQPGSPISEEFSLDIDTLAVPEPTPMEFPSLQTSITPMPMPKEETFMNNPSAPESTPPQSEEPTRLPEPDRAFFNVPPKESPLADAQPWSLPAESTTESDEGTSPKTSNTTYELDISDIQSPDEPDWPNLPEQTDALMTPSPNEVTIVDEPSPFASASHPPVDPTIESPEAEEADDDVDLESLFSDEQPRPKRD
jgi:hypothetical protein